MYLIQLIIYAGNILGLSNDLLLFFNLTDHHENYKFSEKA